MLPLVLDDAAHIGPLAAQLVLNRLAARPAARLVLASDGVPGAVHGALRDLARAGTPASPRATVLQPDELAGLGPSDPRSVAARLRAQLAGTGLERVVTIDGAAHDLDAEAAAHAERLEAGPIDLAVLALAPDGSVALDEPPARLASGVRRVTLTAAARERAGIDGDVAREALTVGLGTLLRVRELLVLAAGPDRAEALRTMLEQPAGGASPAALLRDHPRLTVVCDRAAAARLEPSPQFVSDRVLIVLGHRDPGISPEHRVSAQSRARLRLARRLAEREPVRAVILSGYTSAGGLSEAEQMKSAWDDDAAPALLEVAGRNTAENASRSLPIVRALGSARRVTVVSSIWHVRVPYFFDTYRRAGLRVSYRGALGRHGWGRLLLRELHEAPAAPAERRAALAAAPAPPPAGLSRVSPTR